MPTPGPGVTQTGGQSRASLKLTTLDGRVLSVPEDFRGKMVLLDFWATWCGPCREEIPHLIAAQQKLGSRGLEIVGVSLDETTRGSAADVGRFAREQKMTWPIVFKDGGAIAQRFHVDAIPAPFLIDGDTGAIVASGDQLLGNNLLKTLARKLPRE